MALNGAESRLSYLLNPGISPSSSVNVVTAAAVVVVTMYLAGLNHREWFRNGFGPHIMRGWSWVKAISLFSLFYSILTTQLLMFPICLFNLLSFIFISNTLSVINMMRQANKVVRMVEYSRSHDMV